MSVSDDNSGPRCLNLSSTESILGVITSYLESFCIKEQRDCTIILCFAFIKVYIGYPPYARETRVTNCGKRPLKKILKDL